MRLLSTILLSLAFLVSAQSQQNVSLTINHFLAGEKFENNVTVQNDLGDNVKFDRMEYYISDIQVIHDGGQAEKIEDLYVLVSLINKTDPTIIELGELNVTKLEGISFRLGVDEENNHADPALWPASHPLAPKNPSMHWGWTSGYRFIALEGKCGPSVDEWIQLHVIGDEFHQQLTLSIDESESENYDINIDADYINLLAGIELKNELIVHGSTDEIIPTVSNFIEKTFTLNGIVDTKEDVSISAFDIYPNPAVNRQVQFNIKATKEIEFVQVYNSLGTLVNTQTAKGSNVILFDNPGIYFISILDDNGQMLASRRVVVL